MKTITTIYLLLFFSAISAQIKPTSKFNRNVTVKNNNIKKIGSTLLQQNNSIEMCSAMDFDFPPVLPNAVVILPNVIWDNGATLKVAFVSSSNQPKKAQRLTVEAKVKKYAKEWEKHANIKFQFTTNSSSADIRIGMDTTSGWWSKIGTDAKNFTGKTMNFGWDGSDIKNGISESRYKRTILHEFGHALGLKHEHQNPAAGICWDWKKAIAFYKRTNGWSEKKTRGNLEALSTRNIGNSTRFDPKSIMIYGISNSITSCDFEVKSNSELSSFDKIGIGNIYPNRTNRHLLGPGLFAYQWTSGWDNVEVVKIGNTNYLFMLKSKTGDVHINRLNQNGSVGAKIFDKKWTTGWTTVRIFQRGSQSFLFLLKKGTGDVHIHKFNSNGTVGPRVYDKKWTSGWSIAEFYNQGSNGFLYLRKTATGKSKIFKVNTNGTIGSQIRETNGTPGWSLAKVFQTNFKSIFFFIDRLPERPAFINSIVMA